MATRATYCFKDVGHKTTAYIHWDGYPAGAAEYFNNALISKSKGYLATKFIKANDAEITQSHEIHGDTEYQYDIELENNNLKAYKVNREWGEGCDHASDNPKTELIFDGSLNNFIKEYLNV